MWTSAQQITLGRDFKATCSPACSIYMGAGCLCAKCCTFFLLPMAGGWTPFINKLLSFFDTKSFLKWTLIKPLRRENQQWVLGLAVVPQTTFFFPSPLDFCFLASRSRPYVVSLTKQNFFQQQDNKVVTRRQFLFLDYKSLSHTTTAFTVGDSAS